AVARVADDLRGVEDALRDREAAEPRIEAADLTRLRVTAGDGDGHELRVVRRVVEAVARRREVERALLLEVGRLHVERGRAPERAVPRADAGAAGGDVELVRAARKDRRIAHRAARRRILQAVA